MRTKIGGVPVTCGLPFIGMTKEEMKLIHAPFLISFDKFMRLGRIFGHYHWNPFTIKRVSVAHPKVIREILQSEYLTYDHGAEQFKIWYDVAGGLVFQENEPYWGSARNLFNPFFTLPWMKKMNPLLTEMMDNLMKSMERDMERTPTGFDCQILFLRMTFDTISRMTFGVDTHTQMHEGSKYLAAFQYMMTDCMRRTLRQLVVPAFLNAPGAEYKRQTATLRSLCYDSIDEMESGVYDPKKADSILSVIWSGKKIPEWMNREELATHLVTLMFAGHDTTSNLLTWMMYYLSQHQDYQERIRQEAYATFGKDGPISAEGLESQRFTNAFIKETLRLKPSGPELARRLNRDFEMDWTDEDGENHHLELKKDTLISYSIYGVQNHPLSYPDRTAEFIPDRFMVDPLGSATSVYAYIPFSYGPRRCLGERLALTEARWLTRKYKVIPAEDWKCEVAAEGNMRARYGIGLRLVPL
ncbi:hypothetical protein SmJEL517_g01703 [Synchytrium microbalum]|uniref:Cytochrome P450 n=1 Tax=Synchytrium microbalum TaxID=1806994 RepID=A0A507C8J4_9FUNG|nr:uncharacterized protein SmJEL517_g01703 [Synchytrium microbalum]TPX35942.1 hypothetical protein SmJEL517_g01703 [Synchytrium microbalum]